MRAGEAIRARTRGALEAIGVTQPQWWVLHQLSEHSEGMQRSEMRRIIGGNDFPEAVDAAVDSAVERGWINDDGTLLRSTPSGTARFEEAAALQRELQKERMHGISEEEFVTTITVLQRTIENVGGDAWHW